MNKKVITLSEKYEQLSKEVDTLQKEVKSAHDHIKNYVAITIRANQDSMKVLLWMINEYGDLDYNLFITTGKKEQHVRIKYSTMMNSSL